MEPRIDTSNLQDRIRVAGRRTLRRLWITCAALAGFWAVVIACVQH